MRPQLLLTYDFPPMGGGIARMAGEIAARYPAGLLVVSTGRAPGDAEADARLPNRVDRLPIPSSRLRTLPGLLRWSRRAIVLARQQEVAFAWCGNIKPALYPAYWLRVRSGIPTGLFVYGMDLLLLRDQARRSAFKRRMARALLADVAVIAAISQWTADLCREVLGELGVPAPPGRVRVVPLGTDPVIFHPGIDTRGIRQRYQLPAGEWLLTVARLTAHKGIDTGIRVLASLAAEFPGLRYAVVGSGADREELEALAASLGIADRVRILSGVPDRDLPAFYNLAGLYLGLSRQSARAVEGFGISLVEASACGVPVVAGRTGGIPEAVREGETGRLVDPEDPVAVARVVRELLANPDERRRLGAGGRRLVEARLNWDRVARGLGAIGEEFSRGGVTGRRGGR
jgi:phosphatidylinositol alpha-1,6-mannosyltransferase